MYKLDNSTVSTEQRKGRKYFLIKEFASIETLRSILLIHKAVEEKRQKQTNKKAKNMTPRPKLAYHLITCFKK